MDSPALWLSKNHSVYKKEISNHHTLLKMLAKGTRKKNTTGIHFQIDEFEMKKGGFTYKDKDNREISIENLNLLVTGLQQSNFKAQGDEMDRLFDFKARLELDGVENISRTLPTFGAIGINTDNLLVGLEGFDIALNGKKQKIFKDKTFTGDIEAKLIALRCTDSPEGYNKWTFRLLSDKMVELAYVSSWT